MGLLEKSPKVLDVIKARLCAQKASGRWRQLTPTSRNAKTSLIIDNQTLVNFSSNDYLSLGNDESVKSTLIENIKRYSLGSGGSTVVCGFDEEKARLSDNFARFLGAERALFVSSGYMANLCVLTALVDESVDIFIDKLSHASIYDALAMKGVPFKRFHHNDMVHLEDLLSQSEKKHRFIITEGLFSITGQRPPLDMLITLKKQYNAMLMVDDAHAIGVVGEYGQGSISGLGFDDIDIISCSLNKAFCHSGAMVCAKDEVIEAILQFARPYLYSSALSAAHVSGINTALSVIKRASDKRQQLQANIDYFISLKKQLAYQWLPSTSAIQLLTLGSDEKALLWFERLKKHGFFCYPMRSPTVSKKNTGLRVVLNSGHQQSDINAFCLALEECRDVLN